MGEDPEELNEPKQSVPFNPYLWTSSNLVAPPGLEPGLSALKGPRVNQLHHGANTQHRPTTQLYAVCFEETEEEKIW